MVNSARRPDRRHWLVAARHPARRDGAVAVVLFLLPAVVALALARTHHQLDSATVTILVSVALALPVVWLTWATYRDARRSGTPVSGPGLAQVTASSGGIAVGTVQNLSLAIEYHRPEVVGRPVRLAPRPPMLAGREELL